MTDTQDRAEQPIEQTGNPKWGPRGSAAATIAARLSFENISHSFNNNDVLKGISLDLAPAEIVCLLGPSGCGKTTLLRIGAGVERPKQGRVILDGQEVAGPDGFIPPEKRSIGLMFQDFALFPHLTILDNVLFGLKQMPRDQALTEARAALNRVGMRAYEGFYPHTLSGGEQQRIALARAIAPRPAVLLMDEPFSGLDRRLRTEVREETLAVLKETRASALMVTHDPEEAMGMADRIALMRSGRLVQLGTPDELYNHPVSAAVARMFSPFNEIEAKVTGKHIETPIGRLPAGVCPDGSKAIIMLRPEAFQRTADSKGIKAMITSARFMGNCYNTGLLIEGWDEPLTAYLNANRAPKVGSVVTITIDMSHVFVFPKENRE